jgi:hypothetical protein
MHKWMCFDDLNLTDDAGSCFSLLASRIPDHLKPRALELEMELE